MHQINIKNEITGKSVSVKRIAQRLPQRKRNCIQEISVLKIKSLEIPHSASLRYQ